SRERRDRGKHFGGLVVERRAIPEAQTLEREAAERLEADRRHARPAHIQTPQVFQFRELRQSQIADLKPAGQSAVTAARRRRLASPAQADADSQIELFKARKERDRVEIEIGNTRGPACAGIPPLDAVETELPESREQLQKVQVDAGDHVAAQIQL